VTKPQATTNVAILISGAGSTMAAVLQATQDPTYGVRVCAVIADTSQAAGLDLARAANVPTAVVALSDFPDRAAWDQAVAATIDTFRADIVLLAGFMRIVGEPVLAKFGGRIVNTHPALLPAFPGARAVKDAIEAGVRVTGCTVMVVDAGVDTGPIVEQAAVPVEDNDTVESLHERIKAVERHVVVHTLGRMAREGWSVEGRRVRIGVTEG
jgi:phosphoribosylglycinamide formyltransferase-1